MALTTKDDQPIGENILTKEEEKETKGGTMRSRSSLNINDGGAVLGINEGGLVLGATGRKSRN